MEATPPVASQPAAAPIAAPVVTDRRPPPRGVMPRGMQTWLMAGLAAFMLLIMFVVGRPEAPARPAPAPAAVVAPTADRVRDYQDRLRALEAQSLAPLPDQQATPVSSDVQRTTSAATRRSHRGGEAAPGVREPLCQQRGSQPEAGVTAARRRPTCDVCSGRAPLRYRDTDNG